MKARARLDEYAKKRRFDVTPEPAPRAAAKREGAPTFMVHKHDATRLHYDLRLEIEGALASWAVPKGPSLDPAVKRLAVQTEDHPLEYGEFEGRIPDGEYGGGDSLVWDRGTWDTIPPGEAAKQREKGHLHFTLAGEKLRGGWHLVRTRRGDAKKEWLLFKGKDDAADAARDIVAERPESVVSGRRITRGPVRARTLRAVHPAPEKLLEKVFPPMLATLVAAPPGDAWIYEVKYDGFRALAALSGGKVALQSRNANDLAGRFPAVARALAEIPIGEAVIDGEIAALDADGASRFGLMQSGAGDEVLFAFDLLWLDGEDLRARPLEERRELLESLLSNAPDGVRLAERLVGGGAAAMRAAKEHGWEGVIAKRPGSTYEPRRSKAWLKVKINAGQELAIVGYTPNTGSKTQVGALLLGVADAPGGPLRFAGKVGTGFTTKVRTDLKKQLDRDAVDDAQVEGAPRMRDAIWVTPRLVAQVKFTEWTGDGKLRHPSFEGLRPDKKPEDCVRERPAAPEATVKLTHPERVLYPRDGITKQEVAAYYEAVAPALLSALAGRPLALQHWHEGIDGPATFRQSLAAHAPPWITSVDTPARTRAGKVKHLVADRLETLAWLAQNAALTLHVWNAKLPRLEHASWVVFDLDPAEGRGVDQAAPVALALGRLLDELKLPSVVKTSGQRGLHVLVPLAPGQKHEEALGFAHQIGEALARGLPDVTTARAKTRREGRLYLDCLQNGWGKTIVAPYSLRAVDGAPVSAPIAWDEVSPKLDPARFTLRTMPRRLAKVGDLFAPALAGGAKLPRLA